MLEDTVTPARTRVIFSDFAALSITICPLKLPLIRYVPASFTVTVLPLTVTPLPLNIADELSVISAVYLLCILVVDAVAVVSATVALVDLDALVLTVVAAGFVVLTVVFSVTLDDAVMPATVAAALSVSENGCSVVSDLFSTVVLLTKTVVVAVDVILSAVSVAELPHEQSENTANKAKITDDIDFIFITLNTP